MRSSPLVRKIAKEHQVDLQQVSGSGLGGRITRSDIESHLKGKGTNEGAKQVSMQRPASDSNIVTPQSSGSFQIPASAKAVSADKAEMKGENRNIHGLKTQWTGDQEFLDGVRVKRERMSNMRQLIAEHMERSVRTSPHVTTTIEIDLHRVVQIREQHKDSFHGREGFPLTYTAFFIFAAAQAIKQHPIVNVSVDGQDVLYKNDINIGVAVSLGSQGLIVPVIRNAGELNLLGIARRLNDIATRARSKRLNPDDVRGGTFSVTNPGGYGSLHSNPIISQPQVAMLSIGCITKRPVVLPGDLIGIRPMIILGLTFDHRVIDGEAGAKFLATVRELLETFEEVPV
jgi:2-oxoglutarate dehydrogenase E2 component (dihydrolipoamide succinyltransferase)